MVGTVAQVVQWSFPLLAAGLGAAVTVHAFLHRRPLESLPSLAWALLAACPFRNHRYTTEVLG